MLLTKSKPRLAGLLVTYIVTVTQSILRIYENVIAEAPVA
jgi:hypothetical protein